MKQNKDLFIRSVERIDQALLKLNKKLMKTKPGTKEYQDIEAEIKKIKLRKLVFMQDLGMYK